MLLLHEFHGLHRYFVHVYESNQVTICSRMREREKALLYRRKYTFFSFLIGYTREEILPLG